MKNYINIILFLFTWLFIALPGVYLWLCNGTLDITYFLGNILVALPLVCILMSLPHKTGRIILLSVFYMVCLIGLTSEVEHGELFNAGELYGVICANPYEVNGLGTFLLFILKKHIILISVSYVLLLILFIIAKINNKKYILPAGIATVAIILLSVTNILNALNYEPYNFFKQAYYVFDVRLAKQNGLKLHFPHEYHATIVTPSDTTTHLHVMAIGESLNYDHFSLNRKYMRETTPHLDTTNNVILYNNYYANAVYTNTALPLLMTSAAPDNFNRHFEEKGIAEAFSEVGYRSVLISHRAQLMNDGEHDYLIVGFDSIIWVDGDEEIPKKLHDISKIKENTFVVLHFLGNHMMYENYTDEYKRYTPYYTTESPSRKDSVFVNAYDNSVLYTDFILSECIRAIDNTNQNATFIFMSDHGEYIDSHTGGHGFNNQKPSKMEYHVPMMVWYSDEYKEAYPEKVANMIKHKDAPVCADHVFWSVLDMANIRIDSTLQQDGMSVFGDTLLPHRRMLLLPDGRSVLTLE